MENLNEKSINVLTSIEKDNILRTLFEGKEGELDAKFLYKGKGAELYEKASNNENYPFIDIEIEAINELKHNSKFGKILEKTEFITDVGSGDGQKAIALLQGTGWKGTYIAEDPSEDMLKIVRKNLVERAPEIKSGNFQILNNQLHLSSNCQNNMYLFLGGTIGNMSDEYIIEELKNMDNNGIISGNKILLSYFTAPKTQEEIDMLIKIYGSKEDRAFHENGIDMLGLSRDDFEYDVIYEKDNPEQKEGPFPGKIKGVIRAKKDCLVQLNNGKTINIEKGKEFTLHYSRRFTKQGIEKLFKKSGCKTEFTVDKEGESLALLSKKPTKIKTFVRKNQKLLLSTLAALSIGLGSGAAINQHNKSQISYRQNELRWGLYGHGRNLEQHHQEALELISALKLDELKNEKDKQTIIDLFNKYIDEHNDSGVPSERLILGFYKEYGLLLINNFGLTHEPYDFFGISEYSHFGLQVTSFNTTMKFERDGKEKLSLTPHFITNNRVKFKPIGGIDYGTFQADLAKSPFKPLKSRVFEYEDGEQTYIILKIRVYDGNYKPNEIYVATEKGKQSGRRYSDFSTTAVNNRIRDKSGLDPQLVSNTSKRGNFNFDARVDKLGITDRQECFLERCDKDLIIETSKLLDSDYDIHSVYVGGKLYYTVLIPTRSGNKLGLASTSIKGPFTTTEFNKMAKKLYKNARNIESY